MAKTTVRSGDLNADVFATPAVALGTAASAGTAGTAVRTDATIVAFDATVPSTQAFGDSAAAGAAAVAARRDHKHAMPAAPDATSVGAIAATIIAAKGDILVGTANDTPAVLTVGANDTILMADSGQTSGHKWVGSQTPSTQAASDAAAEGTADTYARGDHKHGMPAFPSGTEVWGEVPSGDLDGADTTYTLANTPSAGTLRVYKNGLRQNNGSGLDYTLATNVITFLAGNIPIAGDIILADYKH